MNQPQTSVGNCLDVQSFINAQPISRYQWRVVILCFLIVFLDGLDTAAIGFIAPALSQDWGIDRASLGPAMSAALIGMVFGALGSGPPGLTASGRKVVLVGAVLPFGAFSLASGLQHQRRSTVGIAFPDRPGIRRRDAECHHLALGIHPGTQGNPCW